jgi:flavin reductase ActVB
VAVAIDQFKEVLKDFPSGVTIVTATDRQGAPVGATVSAFASLSLEPPLILVCLKEDSRTAVAIRQSRAFVVHLLDEGQKGLAIRFADDTADKFSRLDYVLDRHGAPCLRQVGSMLTCSLHSESPGGDHVILVGLVEEAAAADLTPLVHARRSYFRLGELIEA